MVTFKPEHEQIFKSMIADVPGVKAGSMFGYPGYKVNGKLAVGLFETGIVAKLGAARVQELIGKSGIEPFEPTPGRAWKDWVLLTDHFEKHRSLFEEAVRYVMNETS